MWIVVSSVSIGRGFDFNGPFTHPTNAVEWAREAWRESGDVIWEVVEVEKPWGDWWTNEQAKTLGSNN